ncbi:MAG: hypothetical protein HKN27_11170 [Silicimonas sp.]|nr:hypothetical protein [Silicimonas sp.]
MGRGFLSGTFLGGIVGAVFIFVSSQTLERQALSFPRPEAAAVDVPAGTEFDQARPESDPVRPGAETRPEADAVAEVPVPDDAPDAPPALDTSALEVPTPAVEAPDTLETVTIEQSDAPTAPGAESEAQVGQVSDLTAPEAPANAPQTETQTPAVTSAPVEDTAPDAGTEESAPQVETEIAALPATDADTGSADNETAPAVASEDTAPLAPVAPEIGEEPSLPTAQAAERAPEGADETVAALDAQDATEEDLPSFLRPVEDLENAGDVETDRLPQVSEDASVPEDTAEDAGTEDASEENATDQAALPTILRPGSEADAPEDAVVEEDATEEVDEAARAELPALLRYAVEFENPAGNPLLSVVLVNQGAPLTQAQLEELPPFLAFGVEAGAPDAAQVARHYRDAGREVVMIPSLPKGATPQDVEQALRVNFETVTEAVAVMDVSGGSFQSDREAVSQVVDVIATSGHGLITFPRGLNTAHQRATRAGVATGLIFRQLDDGGEDAAQIQRTMDRAAFRARQDEAVILVGTTNATTLISLVEWALGNRAESVSLAPISAALAGGG